MRFTTRRRLLVRGPWFAALLFAAISAVHGQSSEPQAEPAQVAAAEPAAEPEAEAEPEAAAATAAAEPEAEADAPQPEAQAEENGTGVGTLIFYAVPWGFSTAIVMAYGMLYWLNQIRCQQYGSVHERRWWVEDDPNDAADDTLFGDAYITGKKICDFHDHGLHLLYITLPSLATIFMCPFILKAHVPLVEWLWPGNSHPGMDVNDSVALFLTPAGLVYALVFASMYEAALSKWNDTSQLFHQEMAHLQHMLILSILYEKSCRDEGCLDEALKAKQQQQQQQQQAPPPPQPSAHISAAVEIEHQRESEENARVASLLKKTAFADNVCKVINGMCLRVLMELRGEGSAYRGPNEWDIVPLIADLTKNSSEDGRTHHDISGGTEQLYSLVMDLITRYEDVRSMRHHISSQGVHLAQWVTIEMLSLFMFFGVVLTKADSPRFEYFVCVLTAVSISTLSLVTADLDTPFHGFIKIKVHTTPSR